MISEPPDFVKDRALEEWHRLSDYMRESGHDKEEYRATYTQYCIAVGHYEWAVATINEEGMTVSGRNESQVKHPAFTVLKESAERIAQASRAFGFTPRDQSELDKRKDKESEQDEFSEFGV